LRGKQRSVHNTYFTLPVLFVMMSNHYALLTNARWSWLVLMLMSLAGALIRLYFVRKHQGAKKPQLYIAGATLIAVVIVMLAPAKSNAVAGNAVSFTQVQAIVQTRCVACHASQPTFAGFAAAPKNILLDTPDRILANAQSLHQQSVLLKAMPIGNLTQMTDAERGLVDAWYRGGARGQ
jgi:uncharacterized membrane protein